MMVLARALDGISSAGIRVLLHRIGAGKKKFSQEWVGEELNMSRETVSRAEKKLLEEKLLEPVMFDGKVVRYKLPKWLQEKDE